MRRIDAEQRLYSSLTDEQIQDLSRLLDFDETGEVFKRDNLCFRLAQALKVARSIKDMLRAW